MSTLPVIPTPSGQRWREFRVRFLPLIVFALTVISIFFIWREHISPPTLVAQAEPVLAHAKSLEDGTVTNLFVERFQVVRAGDPIASIITRDNRRLDTQMQALRSQISLAQLQLATLVDRDRLAFDYQDLRSELMRQETELAAARAQLPHAQSDASQAKALVAEKVISEFESRAFQSVFEALQAQVNQMEAHVATLAREVAEAQALGGFSSQTESTGAIRQTLAFLEEESRQLRLLGNDPVVLEAPIDGVITAVHRRPGEAFLAGEPIVTISAQQSERLVGYLPQPIPFQLEPGMSVQLRTRHWKRLESPSAIAAVGTQFEVVTNIAFLRPGGPSELGLPLAIAIPESLREHLRPGELVDVIIRNP